ncbi:hypothetical protein [Duganella sp. BJB476]|uniref:hypothetical protein n=1 Tax=Duganella sp. BJB476 TaxID=1871176 RepID=UPI000E3513F4|nr:hypothetical protein [Duganella sp. BJB476]RFP32407.1 hypothetical protein D0T21_09385 [Duganella sp. BJB476]
MKAVAILLLASVAGCASVQQAVNGYESAAGVSLRAAQDNAIAVWTFAGCATPYSAVLRNPQILPALRALCGPLPMFDQVPAAPAYAIPPRSLTP